MKVAKTYSEDMPTIMFLIKDHSFLVFKYRLIIKSFPSQNK